MEENKNKFWKGFLIGAICFFIIGALAVLGMTRLLERVAEKRGGSTEITTEVPTTADQTETIPGTQPGAQVETTAPAGTTAPSTAIAPVTLPSGETTQPAVTTPAETTPAETTPPHTYVPESTETPLIIDRMADPFLNELNIVQELVEENQVLSYDMTAMQEAALKAYVELAGGNWEEYKNAKPEYPANRPVTVIERTDSPFLNRMGEIRDMVDLKIAPDARTKIGLEVDTLKAFVAASGDVYSNYLTAEEWESTQTESDGSYCGIGVQIMQDPETMEATVTNVFSNSPAKEAGILAGDIFKKVDGMDVTQMLLEQMVTYIRGHEGEPVTITVYRPANDETMEITCVRRQVEVDTVSYRMLTDKIGYLELMEFDNVTIRQVREALEELQKAGMEKLVLDLRGNPGGLLNSVLSIADYFTKRGDLLFRMDYKGGEVYTEKAQSSPIFQGDMVVLVNGGSASAAEVLTGILQDYKLGTVMGETTFGKGIVQSFYDTIDGGVLKLTIAHYYSPLGRDFHGSGIEPDVKGEDNVLTPDVDELLEQAVEYLK